MTSWDLARIDQNELVHLAQTLVRFPSPQTDRMEAEPAVQAFIGECVAPELAERGFTGRRDRMGNLLIEAGPTEAGRSLLLMAYAMTHPASSMHDPYSGAVVSLPEGKAVRGRGISEQKGALAAAIVALARAVDGGRLQGRLVFAVSSAGETGRHDAAESILLELGYTPELGIVVLGTNNRVSLANKGRLDIQVTVHGKAAHSSTPWLGINAIDGARAVLERLQTLSLGSGKHAALGEATLTSTHLSSGPNATHTIQNAVHLMFDRRLLPGQDPQTAFDVVAAALAEIKGPWRIEARRGPYMYPCEISRDGPLFSAIRISRAESGQPEPETLYSHGALDAGFLVARGCDAAMWGPGRTEQFHADDEQLLVSELVAGAQGYLALIESYLGAKAEVR
jgi:acetylornithine deacetylase